MTARRLSAILASVLLACGMAAAQSFDQVQVETVRLEDHLHLVQRAGGNIAACVGDDGTLLVDAGYEQLHGKLAEALRGIGAGPVRYVLNTHWHFDHVGGNAGFAGTGAVVIAHDSIRRTMAAGQHLAVLDRDVPAAPDGALPAITYTDDLAFHVNGEEIRIFHIPDAHSGGDGVVQFVKANVIHTGDIVFNCGYPFIDVNNGGTIDGLIEAVERIISLCDDRTRVIPGHGPLGTREDLKEYLSMLRSFRDIVAAEVAAGKDLAAIMEGKTTAPVDEKYGERFFPPERFTELVFRSLK